MDVAQNIAALRERWNLVFDDLTIANDHQEKEKYNRIRKIEYLVTEQYYFFYLVTLIILSRIPQSIFKQNYARESIVKRIQHIE